MENYYLHFVQLVEQRKVANALIQAFTWVFDGGNFRFFTRVNGTRRDGSPKLFWYANFEDGLHPTQDSPDEDAKDTDDDTFVMNQVMKSIRNRVAALEAAAAAFRIGNY